MEDLLANQEQTVGAIEQIRDVIAEQPAMSRGSWICLIRIGKIFNQIIRASVSMVIGMSYFQDNHNELALDFYNNAKVHIQQCLLFLFVLEAKASSYQHQAQACRAHRRWSCIQDK